MNGHDLRRAIVREFPDDGLEFTVRTEVNPRTYQAEMEVYITEVPDCHTADRIGEFVVDWFKKNRDSLRITRRTYVQTRGYTWWYRTTWHIADVTVRIGAFAL